MITAASEDAHHDAADTTDLQDWAAYFGTTHPLVLDPGALTDRLYDPSARTRPTYVLLGPGAEILSIGSSVSDAAIEAALPTPYP